MQFNKVVSQNYKQLFSPSYFIRRLKSISNINLNSYLSALSFFRLRIRRPILSIRRKRPIIVKRSSLYNRVFKEKFCKKKYRSFLKLRYLLAKKASFISTKSGITKINSTFRRLRFLRRKEKPKYLLHLLKKKISFSAYKKSKRSFTSNLRPLSNNLILGSKLNFDNIYYLWLKILRINPLSQINPAVVAISLMINSPRKKEAAFFKKKLLPFSVFSRILGKKIIRAKLYQKGRRRINNDYFIYDLHRSRLFSFSLYSFLTKNYLYKKRKIFHRVVLNPIKKTINRKVGFQKMQKFNAKIIGTSTFKNRRKTYLGKRLSKLYLKLKIRSRKMKRKIPVKRYRVKKVFFRSNRITVKQRNFLLNPYLKFIYRKIKLRKIRRLKRSYFFIKRRRRFKLFLRRKKHKKKSLHRSSKIGYKFNKENLNFIRKTPSLKLTSLMGRRKRRFKRKFKFYNFLNRNLNKTSIALSKVDRKLFRKKRFSYYHGKRLFRKKLKHFNKKLSRAPVYVEKEFLIRLKPQKPYVSSESLGLNEIRPGTLHLFRRKASILNRILDDFIIARSSQYRLLINTFKLSKVRCNVNYTVSVRNYDYSRNLNRMMLCKVAKSFPILFSRQSLLAFVRDKVSLLRINSYILFSVYDKIPKDSLSLITYNGFLKNVFSSILYIKNILLSTEARYQDSITRTNMRAVMQQSNAKVYNRGVRSRITNRVKNLTSKIKLFIGTLSLYKPYSIVKLKKQSRRALRLQRLKLVAKKIKWRNLRIRFKKLGFIRKTQYYRYTKLRAPLLRNRSDVWVQPNATIHNFKSLLAKRGLLFKAENLVRLLIISVKFNKKLKKFKKNNEIRGNLLVWFLNRFRPMFGIKPRRKGSAIIQIPMLLTTKRSVSIGHRQFVRSVGKRPEYSVDKRILSELLSTVEKRSSTYKSLTEQLKLTYSNRVLL